MLEAVRDTLEESHHSFAAPPSAVRAPAPRLFRIGGATLILTWDLPSRVWRAGRLEPLAGAPLAPLASLRLQREDGGTRVVWAFRRPEAAITLAVFAGTVGPSLEVAVDPEAEIPALDPARLLEGLSGAARLSLLSAFLDAWPSTFRLRRSRGYARMLHGVIAAAAPTPGTARLLARLDGANLMAETAVAEGFGAISAVHRIAPGGFERLRLRPKLDPPNRRGSCRLHLVLGGEEDARETFLVLMGANGFAIRRLEAEGEVPTLGRWWRGQSKPDAGLRERAIAFAAETSDAGRCGALEFQLQCPLQARRLVGGTDAPEIEVNLALATPAGVLAGGWMRDPLNLVEGIDLMDADETPLPLGDALRTFSVMLEKNGNSVPVRGFLALGPRRDGVPLLQPRFALRLKSGERHALVPPPQPADPVQMRSRALGAVPPQMLTPAILSECLGPALGAIQRRILGELGAPTVVEIGPRKANPVMSIVVPVYRVVEFLRVQVAAFAADPSLREDAEFIYVLDSPEQADGVEHLLRGLALLYGLSFVLVVMPRNAGFAIASNAGARQARGAVIAQVNSDVIPVNAGWLHALAARLSGAVGAVGPKLLFGDGSLQHAGMYFARGIRGNWLNHHFHKGMPGSYPPAAIERSVPAVTGACVVMRRDLYEAVGGFTEDYVIGDYEDSDLCLKVRAKGRDIRYVPEAVLYHLERKSMSASPDHARGTASAYNAWLHAERWGAAMTALMATDAPPADVPHADAPRAVA